MVGNETHELVKDEPWVRGYRAALLSVKEKLIQLQQEVLDREAQSKIGDLFKEISVWSRSASPQKFDGAPDAQ